MKIRKGFWQWGLALVLVLGLTGPAVAAQQYQFQDLGVLTGLDSSTAHGIRGRIALEGPRPREPSIGGKGR
jgi:hypothetical protein